MITSHLRAATALPPTASPREVGIPEEAVLELLNRLEKTGIPMHALLIMRHGKLVTEGYYAPFGPDMLHRMFSICKSLNALAIGLLEAEGKLQLDDKIVDYFPDKVPADVHPFVSAMTIRDMLMMRTCHASTTYKYDKNVEWIESFFTVAPTHKPGTIFHYDTSAAHVLCALVERLSGENMLDFLRSRVLRKIGWSEEAYVLLNPYGDLQGGSGLMCTARDLLLLGQLLLQHGAWKGEQLLPEKFVDIAVSNLTSTAMSGPSTGELPGYGYQIWRGEQHNFVLYGLGGQFVICLPDYDMVCVTCADTQGMSGSNRLIFDCIYETLLPSMDMMAMGCYPMTLNEGGYTAFERLQDKLKTLHIQSVCEKVAVLPPEETCQAAISGKTYIIEKNPAGFDHFRLTFLPESEKAILSYTYKDDVCELPLGINHPLSASFPVYNMHCCTSGSWINPNTFYIECHLLDTSVGSVRFEVCYGDEDVTVFMKKIEETLFSEYNGHLYGKRK